MYRDGSRVGRPFHRLSRDRVQDPPAMNGHGHARHIQVNRDKDPAEIRKFPTDNQPNGVS